MNDATRARLKELTARARAAFASVPEDEHERTVDAIVAETRQEMSAEFRQSGEISDSEPFPARYERESHLSV